MEGLQGQAALDCITPQALGGEWAASLVLVEFLLFSFFVYANDTGSNFFLSSLPDTSDIDGTVVT